jgi:SET domain
MLRHPDSRVLYRMSGAYRVEMDAATGQRRTVATAHLPSDETLLVERGVQGTVEQLVCHLASDPGLRESLHPRQEPVVRTRSKVSRWLLSKVYANCFESPYRREGESSPETFSLYEEVSSVNHSCNSNCIAISGWSEAPEDDVMKLVTVDAIWPGEEITISYGPGHGHEEHPDWKCGCGLDRMSRELLFYERRITAAEKHALVDP